MSEVLLEREGAVATLILNRPDRLNAMNASMGRALGAHVEALKHDRDLRVVILTGAGRAFTTGGDLDMLASFPDLTLDEASRTMEEFYRLFLCIRDIPVPVIAAINGPAVGAGVCLTLACDVRVAREHASLALNFTRLGLHPGCGATYFLPRIIGRAKASQLLMTGRTLTAPDAVELGLLHAAVAGDVWDDALDAMARDLCRVGPLALRQLKAGFRAAEDEAELGRVLRWEARSQAECYQTEDFREGVRAAREKRPPEFQFK